MITTRKIVLLSYTRTIRRDMMKAYNLPYGKVSVFAAFTKFPENKNVLSMLNKNV